MFKYLLLSLSLIMTTNPAMASIKALTCEPEWAALLNQLAGDLVRVKSATSYLQDPHHIQARPSLIAKARRADLMVCSGAELEIGWLPLLLRKSGNPKIQHGQPGYFMATDYVALLDKPSILDRSQGDIHEAGNPHIQLDPNRILRVADKLVQRLIQIDGENETQYLENWQQFKSQWQQNIQQWQKQVAPLKGKTMVVHHDSWVYLSQWTGLKKVATLEPKSGVPPTSSHLSKLLRSLSKKPADMIIYASYQDDTPAKWLAQKTGISALALDFTVADNETLSQWMNKLIARLLELQKP